MKLEKIFYLILLFCLTFLSANALSIPDKANNYVNDFANLLKGNTKQDLNSLLLDFEKKTSNQVVLATFNSLDGESLEDFSMRIAEKWKIGNKEKDNGVILLVFKNDRKIRIEVGYGLEGVLPDAICDQIIRHDIVPYFKSGDYDAGVLNGINSIIQAIKNEYKANKKNPDYSNALAFVFFLAFVFPLIGYLLLLIATVYFFGIPMGIVIGIISILILDFIRRLLSPFAFGETLSGGSNRWFDGGYYGGGFGGGGFSSGGGSFGGGGSSGNW